jgi:hypothetical protein
LSINAALSRFSEERFIDKEELVGGEIPASKVKIVGKVSSFTVLSSMPLNPALSSG